MKIEITVEEMIKTYLEQDLSGTTWLMFAEMYNVGWITLDMLHKFQETCEAWTHSKDNTWIYDGITGEIVAQKNCFGNWVEF